MNELENNAALHENVWLLLPWYVNGTLETAERRLVDGHLAACGGCREELARCKGLAAALLGRQESAPSPHPIQLARLMERIEASERGPAELSQAGGRRPGSGRPAFRLLGGTPRPVRWALAGQLAALILLAAAVAFGPARRFQPGAAGTAALAAPHRTPEYVTLSAPAAGSSAAVAAARPQIRLVFAETATEKQMRDVLVRTRGRLVDGPSPAGAYTLELPAPPPVPAAAAQPDPAARQATQAPAATPESRESRESQGSRENHESQETPAAPDSVGTILAYLRSQRIVRFAEPVAGAAWSAAPAGPGAAQGSPAAPRP
ncbi:MAG: zf-HC2 domain-containing protein [Acidobacteria bacterium]|nr:zf-HC2 domain-containing protein [Acidobacteriota bacterium]